MTSFKAEVTVDDQGVQFGPNLWLSFEKITGDLPLFKKKFSEWREDQQKKAESGDRHRGTGRTTRMLKYAREQAKAGKRICVVGWSLRHISDLRDMYIKMKEEEPFTRSTYVVCTSPVVFASAGERLTYSPDPMQRPQFNGDTYDEVCYDHYTIERSIEEKVREMHRWDEDAPKPVPVPSEDKKPRDPFELAMEMLNSGQVTFIKKPE